MSNDDLHNLSPRVPLLLQSFFDDRSQLDRELARRYPSLPLMSIIKFRNLADSDDRAVAMLSAQDGSASLTIDVSSHQPDVHLSYTLASMLTFRFHLYELSDLDRQVWTENMVNQVDEVVFLWGQSRWEKDYLICVSSNRYVDLIAFSVNGFEAAVRITPSVAETLFDWLRDYWFPEQTEVAEPDEDDEAASAILGNW